ncbi:MAG: hypothetical protein WDO73_29355 [Ignavibacteriota bacterium]
MSLFTVISSVRIWFRQDLRRITKLKFSLVGLSCIVLIWFAIQWRFIGPATRF